MHCTFQSGSIYCHVESPLSYICYFDLELRVYPLQGLEYLTLGIAAHAYRNTSSYFKITTFTTANITHSSSDALEGRIEDERVYLRFICSIFHICWCTYIYIYMHIFVAAGAKYEVRACQYSWPYTFRLRFRYYLILVFIFFIVHYMYLIYMQIVKTRPSLIPLFG